MEKLGLSNAWHQLQLFVFCLFEQSKDRVVQKKHECVCENNDQKVSHVPQWVMTWRLTTIVKQFVGLSITLRGFNSQNELSLVLGCFVIKSILTWCVLKLHDVLSWLWKSDWHMVQQKDRLFTQQALLANQTSPFSPSPTLNLIHERDLRRTDIATSTSS